MQEGPPSVQTWLRKKGNEVEARLNDPTRPLAIGALETFLTQRVGWALEAGRGKIRNLRRLDIRLGLIGLDQNRALSTESLRRILHDGLANDQSGARYFSQRGKLEGDEIHLHGRVFFSNTAGFVGAHVTTSADLETGAVTWTFESTPTGLLTFTTSAGVATKID